MLTVEEGCTQAILGNTTFTGLAATRLYPVTLPETPQFPAATYQVISGSSENTLYVASTEKKRIQYCAYSASYREAKQVAKAIIGTLDDFTGTLPSSVRVIGVVKTLEMDEFMEYARVYRVLVEFVIEFEQ